MNRITHLNGMASITFCLARVNLLKRNIIFTHCNWSWFMPHFLQSNETNNWTIVAYISSEKMHWASKWAVAQLAIALEIWVTSSVLQISIVCFESQLMNKLNETNGTWNTGLAEATYKSAGTTQIFGFRNKNTNTQMLYFFSCCRPTMASSSSINANLINKSVELGKSILNDQCITLYLHRISYFSRIDSKKKIKFNNFSLLKVSLKWCKHLWIKGILLLKLEVIT